MVSQSSREMLIAGLTCVAVCYIVCCSGLERIAVCCSVALGLQHVATERSVLQCVVCYSVLQWYSVSQCVTACYSMLQCVDVC